MTFLDCDSFKLALYLRNRDSFQDRIQRALSSLPLSGSFPVSAREPNQTTFTLADPASRPRLKAVIGGLLTIRRAWTVDARLVE